MKTTNFRIEWVWAIRILLAAGWGLFGTGCAAHAPAPQVEAVGTLAAGPSVYSAPVAHDAPPELGGVADTGDDLPAADTSLDVLRREAAQAGAVEVEAHTDGLTVGGGR